MDPPIRSGRSACEIRDNTRASSGVWLKNDPPPPRLKKKRSWFPVTLGRGADDITLVIYISSTRKCHPPGGTRETFPPSRRNRVPICPGRGRKQADLRERLHLFAVPVLFHCRSGPCRLRAPTRWARIAIPAGTVEGGAARMESQQRPACLIFEGGSFLRAGPVCLSSCLLPYLGRLANAEGSGTSGHIKTIVRMESPCPRPHQTSGIASPRVSPLQPIVTSAYHPPSYSVPNTPSS
jgi:hypothetical protein